MSTVEAVDTSSVSRSREPHGQSAGNPAGLFSAVFQSARLSASRMIETMLGRAGAAGTSSRGHQRVIHALSDSQRQGALKRGSETPASDGTGRVDRLRSIVQEDDDGAVKRASDRRSDRDARGTREQAIDDNREQLSESVEQVRQKTPAPRPADGVAESNVLLTEANGERRTPGVAIPEATSSASKEGDAAPQPAHGESAPVPAALPNRGAEVFAQAPGTPSATGTLTPQLNQQGQGSDRGIGSGAFQDSAQTGAAGKAGAAAERAGQTSADFQNVLQSAGRLRGQSTEVRSILSPTQTGSPAAPKGVNLNEARGLNELAQVVRSSIGSRHSTMMLRLDPPGLGQLRIDVRMHDQMLTVRMEAETHAGHETLQAKLDQLRGALEQQGIQVQRVEVELRPPPTSGQTHDPGGQQQAGQDPGHPGAGGAQGGSGEGAGSWSSGQPAGSGDTTGAPGGGPLPEEESYGGIELPAETGVDLVV